MNSKNYYIWLFIVLLLPVSVFADVKPTEYLVGIPGIDNPDLEFGDYINALYALSISIAALLAVIKIIIAGVKWMLSDIVTSKQEAKSDIWGATLGLLLVISAVLILGVINPQLTTTSIFLTPSANIGTNTPFTPESKTKCLSNDPPGEWTDTTASDADGGYCTYKKEKLFLTEYSCKDPDVPPPEVVLNCPKAKALCESNNGIASDAISAFDGSVLIFKINCSEKPVPAS